MAILYPGGSYRQLAGKSTTLLSPRIIDVHTMVWNMESCEDYFAQAGNPYSHFGTGPDGEVRQWQDLTYRAASDLNGNPFCISIENADSGPGYPTWSGSDVPRFTPAQAEALAQLIAWLCIRFGLPPHLVPDSLTSSVGPGYHRHGIDPYRVPGGVLYSSKYAKACPGDRRIDQIANEIMPRVREILGGSDVTPEEHDWLADILRRVQSMHGTNYQSAYGGPSGDLSWLDQKLDPILDRLEVLETSVASGTPVDEEAIAAAVVAAMPTADPAAVAAAVETIVRRVFADAGQA